MFSGERKISKFWFNRRTEHAFQKIPFISELRSVMILISFLLYCTVISNLLFHLTSSMNKQSCKSPRRKFEEQECVICLRRSTK